ncbi:MAG: hypothetical protein A4E35_01997 [Methanoregula sp. PtaU1.Bin051]|nr:MAG: hypothetical protein A4E35_01997 [Methanoregula sp. PtaU1.Bin051]
MKRLILGILAAFIIFAGIQCASAYTVTGISVSPSGDLTPGTAVTTSFTVQLSSSGDYTFPESDTLVVSTDLDSAVWNYVIVKNDIEEPQAAESGKQLNIDAWLISYPASDYAMNLKFTMTGVAPQVTATSDKTIVEIKELDNRLTPVSGSVVTVTRKVINTAEVTELIASRESELQALRAHIDEKGALEVDTAEAEAKYSAAQAAINDAKSQPSSAYSVAITSLNNAGTIISDGEKVLDKAWAEKEVADAQVPITKADEVITWLKPNATSGDPKSTLTGITTKREIAAGLISTANDEIFAGRYDRAREKATEAYTKGNETYNDALALKKQLQSGWSFLPNFNIKIPLPGGSFTIILVVVVVVIGVVGYVIYRKRTQWDELG